MSHAEKAASDLREALVAYHKAVRGAVAEYGQAALKMMDTQSSDLDATMQAAAHMIREMRALAKVAEEQQKAASAFMAALMVETGSPPVRTPDLTAYVSHPAKQAQIVDESALPDDVWTKPRPDRQEIARRLRRGEAVTGAALTNGGPPFLGLRAVSQEEIKQSEEVL